jgi:hypothetical protein
MGAMGWLLLFLVLIAAAFGVLGAVIKATVFVVLTIVFVAISLGLIAYLAIKHQARKIQEEFERRIRPPRTELPRPHDDRY